MGVRFVLACIIVASIHSLSLAEERSRPVNLAELRGVIDHADHVVVDASSHLVFEVVYSSADGKDLSALKSALSFKAVEGDCLCMPAARIHLLRKKKELGTALIYPDGLTIGFSDWSSDARIQDAPFLSRPAQSFGIKS